MSLTVLHALREHRSPEHFIRSFLITALKEPELGHVPKRLNGVANLRKGVVSSIYFTDDGKRVMPLEVVQTHRAAETVAGGTTEHSLPHMHVGTFSSIGLTQADFDNAESQFGKRVFTHPGEGGSDTHRLNLPISVVDHWRVRKKVIYSKGIGALVVYVDSRAFNELKEATKLDVFSKRFMIVLNYLRDRGGQMSRTEREALRMRRFRQLDLGEATGASDPVGAFVEAHEDEIDLIKRISTARTLGEIKTAFAAKFGPGGRADRYSDSILHLLSGPNGRIAGDHLAATLFATRIFPKP